MRRFRVGLLTIGTLCVGQMAHAQGASATFANMGEELARLGVWLLIAAILFAITYRIVDIVVPGRLRDQLAEGNTALAIFAGALFISAAIIIAALIH